MDITDELITDLLKETSIQESLDLLKLIKDKKNISEFRIAEKLNISVNVVRNLLYKLNYYNLVSSVRKKDKKKGWYIYYWTFNDNQALSVLKSLKLKRLSKLKAKLKEEDEVQYFICPKKCLRLKYENALEYNFKCPECSTLLRQEDTKKQRKVLRERIDVLEKGMSEKPKEAS